MMISLPIWKTHTLNFRKLGDNYRLFTKMPICAQLQPQMFYWMYLIFSMSCIVQVPQCYTFVCICTGILNTHNCSRFTCRLCLISSHSLHQQPQPFFLAVFFWISLEVLSLISKETCKFGFDIELIVIGMTPMDFNLRPINHWAINFCSCKVGMFD